MRAPDFWWRPAGFVATALGPLGWAYGAFAQRRFERPGASAGVPVVCIGNPTVGGAGKTPTAIAVARLLRQMGERPAFLTRGYRGRIAGPHPVDAERDIAADVGDEALLLAAIAPTVVARDRPRGAARAVAEGAGVIVMDDGFQNPSLRKDMSILVVDGHAGMGNGRVFPAGPLRLPLAPQLARADAVLVVEPGAGGETVARAAAMARRPVLRARLDLDLAALSDIERLRLFAFAGIGRPGKFFDSLARHGAPPVRVAAFPDHHAFTAADARRLVEDAERDGLRLVTTEKDHARMRGNAALDDLRARTMPLPVRLIFEDDLAVKRLLAEALARRRG